MNNPNGNMLHAENVYKQYGDHLVLDNIDVSVKEGEFCTVVGPSGCGKSTMLRLILGQESPTEGKITIDGKPVGRPNVERGIVYQKYSLFPHLTVLDNVTLGLNLQTRWLDRRKRRPEFEKRANDILERVRLGNHGHKYPHELSGGMQQRAAIAQALIMKPRILLMDEPFGALDPNTREDVQLFLLELWEQENMTIFFVTHDLEEAAFLGTRLLVISQFYTDDRGHSHDVKRGAKIVVDKQLARSIVSPDAKEQSEFRELIQSIRKEGFNPEYLQHVNEFGLTHQHSFQTLTEHENNVNGD